YFLDRLVPICAQLLDAEAIPVVPDIACAVRRPERPLRSAGGPRASAASTHAHIPTLRGATAGLHPIDGGVGHGQVEPVGPRGSGPSGDEIAQGRQLSRTRRYANRAGRSPGPAPDVFDQVTRINWGN